MAIFYGRYHNQSRPDWGWIGPNQMRAVTFDKAPSHMWVYRFGIWAGKNTNESSANVSARLALYATASLNPDDRLGYSTAFTVSTPMLDSVSGASHTANVAAIDVDAESGAVLKAIPVSSGFNYSIAVLASSGYLSFGMIAAARINANNERFYDRYGIGQPPPNPFGAYTSSNEGHIAMWVEADPNSAPSAPTFRTPNGSILTTEPEFHGHFLDSDKDRGDYLNQYRIQVRRKSDGASMWSATFDATPAERTPDGSGIVDMARAYGGTTLVRGTAYEWRVQMSDHFNAWSPWSSWLEFTPSALGTVTLDSSPSGKIEVNGPNFNGRWTHQTSQSMKRAQVRVLDASGNTVLQNGADFDITDTASSAAPGTLFTVNWAESGLTPFAWGKGYQYQIRGYDGTQWSDWSNKRSFKTNAAPTVPSGLSPTNGIATSSYPLLTASFSDADDTPATGLTGFARIKNAAGSVLFTRTMVYNTSTGWWEYQTTGTDLATYATYKWDAYSYDGTLYSGTASIVANATKSSEATFVYAEGPSVDVTSPLDGSIVTTSSINVTWNTTNQVRYRVYVYADGGTQIVYDSGELMGDAASYLIPSGYVSNNTPYDIVVWVEDTNGLEGQSFIIDITVEYPATDQIANFTVDQVNIGSDLWASAVRLNWDQTLYATDTWQDYTITRTAGTGADAERIILARITSPTQTTFTDYTPASGVEYSYAITQTIMTGLDMLPSEPVVGSASVTLGGVVLVSVTNPTVLRTNLRYTNEREHGRTINESVYEPVSGVKPTTVRSRTFYQHVTFDAKIFADAVSTSLQRRVELEAIDEDGGTYSYRDNHGRKMFVTIPGVAITDHVPDWYIAAVELREVKYSEGLGKANVLSGTTPLPPVTELDGGAPATQFGTGDTFDGGTP